MAQPKQEKDADSEKTPESRKFEDALTQILTVSKEELNRREAEARLKKGK